MNHIETSPPLDNSQMEFPKVSEEREFVDLKPTEDDEIDLTQKLADAQNEVTSLKDKYLRLMAEMENLRRRTDKEKQDIVKYSNENILRDLIPVLDSFDKAIIAQSQQNKGQEFETFQNGVLLIHKELLHALNRHGLETVKSEGQPFDPNVHQAIQRIEKEGVLQDTVEQEFARGYTLNGRLVRPAMVSVAVAISVNGND